MENYYLVSPMILLEMKARVMVLPSFFVVLICWLAQIPRQMYAVLPMVAWWPSGHYRRYRTKQAIAVILN